MLDLLRTKAADPETSGMSMTDFLKEVDRFIHPQDDDVYLEGFDRLQRRLGEAMTEEAAARTREVYERAANEHRARRAP